MNGWKALDRFLQTDPHDVGCAEAMELLHVTPNWQPLTPRRRDATRASQVIWPRADRVARTSTACPQRSAAQRNDSGPGENDR